MRPLRTFAVEPALPDKLAPLRTLANNLWWYWHAEARDVFRRLDPALWEAVHHNPVAMLGKVSQDRLRDAAADQGFLAHLERVQSTLQKYMGKGGWWCTRYGEPSEPCVVYFCAEFGLAECLPIYSGGLGVLAGDHLKSASELGIPLVGIGLLYQQGYFRQRLNADGWQMELFPRNDFHNIPVEPIRHEDGSPLMIEVDYPGRNVAARIWKVQVGRIPLYLLDSNLPRNSPEDRQITAQLYGGDQEMRIRQEIMLGIGGVRALRALNLHPKVYHMNEGHSAFLGLERTRLLMHDNKMSFDEALQAVIASSVFTTHTPVPAGNDAFEPWLIDRYFEHYWPQLHLSRDQFLAFGRQDPGNRDEPMNLTVLAMQLSSYRNGVSRLHGAVSRRLWHNVWPSLPMREVPITHITNGIHTRTWLSDDMTELYNRYLGPDWEEKTTDEEIWKRLDDIPDTEIWRTHERRRERLVAFARRRLHQQYAARGASRTELRTVEEVLDPEALTIGFARRFATYKRATLILSDLERLTKLVSQSDRRVQFIFAGKAHPRDNPGKDLIRQIVHIARKPELRRSILFLEDYDMAAARYMVQGVDVWLNTPLRPMEASGTSGMKAAANGVLNMSIPDGWWDEGCEGDVGWRIGSGETYDDLDFQNRVESEALYDLLEKEVVPLFYDRGRDGLPREWVRRMRNAMRKLAPVFNTNRMVREYAERFYVPASQQWDRLTANGMAKARDLAHWTGRVRSQFPGISIESVTDDVQGESRVGAPLKVRASIRLGELSPEDVQVQLFFGNLDTDGQLTQGDYTEMAWTGQNESGGSHTYEVQVTCQDTGITGYTLRVLPRNENLTDPKSLGLVRWA
ncbi:MAG: glycosyltransferase family 1 protein [Planctomycetes bacterium]|nr:glycosyltransferase family 1 protein [Planctomycetota bacterium]